MTDINRSDKNNILVGKHHNIKSYSLAFDNEDLSNPKDRSYSNKQNSRIVHMDCYKGIR